MVSLQVTIPKRLQNNKQINQIRNNLFSFISIAITFMTIIPMSSCKDSKQYNLFEEINENDFKKPSTIPPLFREVLETKY